MTDRHWQLEKEVYTITAPSDLVLRVVEHQNTSSPRGATTAVRAVPIKVHVFRVDLETLAGASEHFNSLLETRPQEISIDENDAGNVTGLLLWLKIIHYVVTDDTRELHLYEIWHVCTVALKYGFNPFHEKAQQWFGDWYNSQPQIKHFTFRDYEQLLFPTKFFGHATGFAHTSKYLAYRSNGTISEVKPEQYRPDPVVSMSTDPAIIVQINAARNRLTTVLHRTLYAPIDKQLNENKCQCGPFTLFAYQKGLADTGCWPIHPAVEKMSIKAVLEALSRFVLLPTQVCRKGMCNLNLQKIVEDAIKDIDGQFAGLCLDCMDASSSEYGSTEDYWYHENFGVAWDEGCRIPHTQASSHPSRSILLSILAQTPTDDTQPTWFFSYMGERSVMNQYLLNKTRQRINNHRQERSTYGYGNNAFQRGGGNNRGSRQEVRNSNRPGRQDSLFSRTAPFSGGYPRHTLQELSTQMSSTNISEFQTAQAPFDSHFEYGN